MTLLSAYVISLSFLLFPTSVESSTAFFAAGCFWSVELAYQRTPGVVSTSVGYIGGHTPNPTYKQVVQQTTGHAEAVRVEFDESVVSYRDLLDIFFDIHDSTQLNRQGNDVGTSYRSLIAAPRGSDQWGVAQQLLQGDMQHAVTQLVPLEDNKFWKAEDYHQKYLEKGGQSTEKGSLAPIFCYGTHRRGPVKELAKKRRLKRIFTRRDSL